MQTFTFKKADPSDKALMDQIFQLRYQVYAHECGFIDPDEYREKREVDKYDAQSTHFVALNQENCAVGTLRLILPGEYPLPVYTHCPQINVDQDSREQLPQIRFSEISRLVITKNLRRRRNDGDYYEPQVEDKKVEADDGREFLRRSRPMAFGLYRELYQESKRLGITHWYSLMEKSLWLLLRIHGFTFECVGDTIDIYGPVNPYIGKVEHIEHNLQKKFPQFYEYLIKDQSSEKKMNT